MSLTLEFTGATEDQIRAIASGGQIEPAEVVVRLVDRFGGLIAVGSNPSATAFAALLDQEGFLVSKGTKAGLEKNVADLWIDQGHDERDDEIARCTFVNPGSMT